MHRNNSRIYTAGKCKQETVWQSRHGILLIPLFALPAVNCIVDKDSIFEAISWGAIGAAVVEELVFRGIFLYILKEYRVSVRVILSSALFALFHAVNLLNGTSFDYAAIQILLAFAIGAAYALCTIRFRSLLPAIASHLAVNITGTGYDAMVENAPMEFLPFYICLAVYIIYDICLYYLFFKRSIP